jgi:hypothetical protein
MVDGGQKQKEAGAQSGKEILLILRKSGGEKLSLMRSLSVANILETSVYLLFV